MNDEYLKILNPFKIYSWIIEIQEYLLIIIFYSTFKLLETLLKTFDMVGPRKVRATITTIATRTRIKAYSTRPCPFSSLFNMATTSLL
jgi:hypothetical protein